MTMESKLYVVRQEPNSLDPSLMMGRAYNLRGDYIGSADFAKSLCDRRGIAPEKAKDTHAICSIGFCEKEQKWYGWSHRAMFGFGIGSKVVRGDCAYVPVDINDAIVCDVLFWSGDDRIEVSGRVEGDEIVVEWVYGPDTPNVKLRGTKDGARQPIPKFGKGEWEAKTLDDARQMAVDFAERVS